MTDTTTIEVDEREIPALDPVLARRYGVSLYTDLRLGLYGGHCWSVGDARDEVSAIYGKDVADYAVDACRDGKRLERERER